jgi:hypothetical protein
MAIMNHVDQVTAGAPGQFELAHTVYETEKTPEPTEPKSSQPDDLRTSAYP